MSNLSFQVAEEEPFQDDESKAGKNFGRTELVHFIFVDFEFFDDLDRREREEAADRRDREAPVGHPRHDGRLSRRILV